MEPVKKVEGKALPLGWDDVDTDQIVPSDALKRIERTGFGQFLFSAWREDADFILNKPEHDGAVVLIAGQNFGSGSSREHAPWAIQDYGFGAVIAESFADIFKNNCAKIGLLAVELPEDAVKKLLEAVRYRGAFRLRQLRPLQAPQRPRRHRVDSDARGRARGVREDAPGLSAKREVAWVPGLCHIGAVSFDERW
jgi:3-isopropylmalate dehydratase small subunit